MQAKSIYGHDINTVKAALERSMQDGFQPTIAIAFISIRQDRKALSKLLADYNIDSLGLTSCGEFVDGHYSEGETAILLMDLPREHYRILTAEVSGRELTTTVESLAQRINQTFAHPGLILCSSGINSAGDFFDGETLIATLKKNLKPGTPFYGGMAGDDRALEGSYVFTRGFDSNDAVIVLVLDTDKIALQGMAVTGWQKMGIARTVTKSEGTLLYAIDDQPAAEMYLKYLGQGEKSADKGYNLVEELSMYYPFIVDRENGETVLRTPIKINYEKQALFLDIEMPIGTQLWFSMPPDFNIVDNILDGATRIKEKTQIEADALLIFSCAGRVNVLGPLAHAENEGLQQIWNSPMAGFFTYGEYGPDPEGNHEFHSGACCWLALKEKK